jgi:hypothetical protein
MAVMTNADRLAARQAFTQELCTIREAIAPNKTDLLAAIGAIDQWISDNAASFNSAIPLPARTSLTTSQKARLFWAVAYRRFVAGV